MSLSLSVFSQSGLPKSVGSGGSGEGRVVYHTSTGQYIIGVATFFFFFFEPGVKLDEKSIENGLEGQKFLVVCLFWGGCHHPNPHSEYKFQFWTALTYCNSCICRKTQSVPPPEKTQGWISLSFLCNCFVFGLIL